jgi:hypothetical protein
MGVEFYWADKVKKFTATSIGALQTASSQFKHIET